MQLEAPSQHAEAEEMLKHLKDRAEPGSYNIQIDSLAKRSSAISNGFKDPNEPSLGIGYLVFVLMMLGVFLAYLS